MGVAVEFSYPAWAASYSMFANVTETQIVNVALPLAQAYHRNDGGGPIDDPVIQTQALWLAVAHVTQLMFGSTTLAASPLVGRIASAGQGSINASVEYSAANQNSAWWTQTTWGAAYWQLIKSYSMGVYRPKVTPLRRAYIYGGIGTRRF